MLGLCNSPLLPLPLVLPRREGTVGCLSWRTLWAHQLGVKPLVAPFPAPFLWLHFSYLISEYSLWHFQSLESPSAEGLPQAMISKADCLSHPARRTRTELLLRPAFWDLLCSAALVATSATKPGDLLAPLQWREVCLVAGLTITANVLGHLCSAFFFFVIQESDRISQEDQELAVLNCPVYWMYPSFYRKYLLEALFISFSSPKSVRNNSHNLNKLNRWI